jgi:hypothetical protein
VYGKVSPEPRFNVISPVERAVSASLMVLYVYVILSAERIAGTELYNREVPAESSK